MPPGGLHHSGQYIADSHDGMILWARVICFKHLSGCSDNGGETDNDELDALRNAAKHPTAPEIDQKRHCGLLQTYSGAKIHQCQVLRC
jgi:hypothetical protein